jgi:HPt (histidine-containing phosphotransfer) domain-containing protein
MEETRALIERLVDKHLESLRGLALRIRGLHAEMRLDGPAAAGEAAAAALGLAHQIAGSAGSIGFGEVSIAARALEEQFRLIVERHEPMDADRTALIRAQIDRLNAIVAAQKPGDSTLLGREFAAAQPKANIRVRR